MASPVSRVFVRVRSLSELAHVRRAGGGVTAEGDSEDQPESERVARDHLLLLVVIVTNRHRQVGLAGDVRLSAGT